MESFYIPNLQPFHAKLRELIQEFPTNKYPVINLRGLRLQLPLYTTSKISREHSENAALQAELQQDALNKNYNLRLEWRSEPAAILRASGLVIPTEIAGDRRLIRPMPILTEIPTTTKQH